MTKADIFHFKDFSMHQAPSGQRVNTDSCVFGALIGQANTPAPKKILDIGTGTGVLVFMLASRFPEAQITAVEPEDAIADVAQINFNQSIWRDRIALRRLRAQDLDPAIDGTHDFVLCNPPYFQNSKLSNDRLRTVARHNSDLSPEELYESMTRMMTPDGSTWLSFPGDSTELWMEQGLAAGLHPTHHIVVKDHPDARPHMAIMGWSMKHCSAVTHETILYRSSHKGKLSPWMQSFRDEWYPAHYNAQFL